MDYLRQHAYEEIKRRILTCEFPPGSMLTEEELQNILGISRTPIREALIRIENSGLISVKPKKGIQVSRITLDSITAVFELRKLLETHAIIVYGNRLSRSSLASFLHFFQDFDPENDPRDKFFEMDNDLHISLINACQNKFITRSYASITEENSRFRIFSGIDSKRIVDTKAEHADILQACLEQNWNKAGKMLSIHFDNAKSSVIGRLINTNLLEIGE